MESRKPQRLIFKTYLQMVQNAPGSRMFRNLYVDGQDDVMKDGAYSCAFFVSSVLTLFRQNSGFHGTIQSTLADMLDHGWEETDAADLQPGDILVWEPWEFEGQEHEHLGFYLGNGRAVSTSYKAKEVVDHSANEGRQIVRSYRQPNWLI
jgi:hypothetical protein